MKTFLGLSLMTVLLAVGCGTDAPVERLDGDEATLTAYRLAEATGERDGAQTQARFVFRASGEDDLVLDVTLGYDPQPTLVSGSWHRGAIAGDVRSEGVRFVGGQGEGPSVGGTYRLEDASGPRYRVTLPLTRVAGGWGP